MTRTNVPLSLAPVARAHRNQFSNAMLHSHGASRLAFTLNFLGGIFFKSGSLAAIAREFGSEYGLGLPEHGFNLPLCHHVGESPVGRGRVRIVLPNAQAEVSGAGLTGLVQHIFPARST